MSGFASFEMDPATKETLSKTLGFSSIGLWLFAQTPQLIANYRNKNCDGLALPFLMNWMAGDLLNMIGCFLTDQLEFQKYLALYFCFVDLGLMGQFWLYYKRSSAKSQHHHRPSKRSLLSSTSSSPRLRSASSPHLSNLHSSSSPHSGLNGSPVGGSSRPGNRRRYTRVPGSFEEMSAAAANVARAAEAVAASKRGGSSANKSSRSRSRRRKTKREGQGETERLEDSVTTLGGDSIHSDASRGGGAALEGPWDSHTQQRTHHSSSRDFLTDSPGSSPRRDLQPSKSTASLDSSSSTTSPILVQLVTHPNNEDEHTPTASERGRTLTRPPPPSVTFGVNVQPPTPEHQGILSESLLHQQQQQQQLRNPPLLRRSGSRSLSVQRGGGSGGSGRSTAGVVLMSLVGLVGLGGLTSSTSMGGRGLLLRGEEGGKGELVGLAGRILWAEGTDRIPLSSSSSLDLGPSLPFPPLLSDVLLSPFESPPLVEEALESATFVQPSPFDSTSQKHPDENEDDRQRKPHHGVPTGPEVTWQRLIGRVSAWTCTVLYLTSRMPQIWKNFTRKSTEGLSVFLFLFAFLANSLYVSSILLNPLIDQPRPESTNYILESLPYVLGSGGTLLFDSTIMIQFFIYGSSKPLPDDSPQPWLNKRSHTSSRHRSSRPSHSTTTYDPLLFDGGDLESAPLLSEPMGGGTVRPRQRSTSAGGREPLFSRSRSRQRMEDVLGLRGIGTGGAAEVEGLPYNGEMIGFGEVGIGNSRERAVSTGDLRDSVIAEGYEDESSRRGSAVGLGVEGGRLVDSS